MSFRRSSTRASYALLAALVWVGGFELAPLVHAVHHQDLGEHTHGEPEESADSFRRTLRSAVQRMATAQATSPASSARERSHAHDGDQVTPDNSVSRTHGAHSAAHRDLASSSAPAALVLPAHVTPVAILAQRVEPGSFDGQHAPLQNARGPPAA